MCKPSAPPRVYASDPRMVSFPPAAPSLSTPEQAALSSALLARSAPVVRQLPPPWPGAVGNIPPSALGALGTDHTCPSGSANAEG